MFLREVKGVGRKWGLGFKQSLKKNDLKKKLILKNNTHNKIYHDRSRTNL
jgi:hypothetical protein